MTQIRSIFTFMLLLVCSSIAVAQADKSGSTVAPAQTDMVTSQQQADKAEHSLDARREKRAIQVFLQSAQTQIVSAVESMPVTKYGFAPTEGEFKGVHSSWLPNRIWGQ